MTVVVISKWFGLVQKSYHLDGSREYMGGGPHPYEYTFHDCGNWINDEGEKADVATCLKLDKIAYKHRQ